jgi:hypothetical protein
MHHAPAGADSEKRADNAAIMYISLYSTAILKPGIGKQNFRFN